MSAGLAIGHFGIAGVDQQAGFVVAVDLEQWISAGRGVRSAGSSSGRPACGSGGVFQAIAGFRRLYGFSDGFDQIALEYRTRAEGDNGVSAAGEALIPCGKLSAACRGKHGICKFHRLWDKAGR